MAFDGITIANLVYEFKRTLEGGKIAKIAQPEKDELLIAVKNNRETYRLQISASASLPLIYLTENNKPSPLTAPISVCFCESISEAPESFPSPSLGWSVFWSLSWSIWMKWATCAGKS